MFQFDVLVIILRKEICF